MIFGVVYGKFKINFLLKENARHKCGEIDKH